MEILKELCIKYNINNPEWLIDLNDNTTYEQLLYCLWERNQDIINLGYKNPHNDILISLRNEKHGFHLSGLGNEGMFDSLYFYRIRPNENNIKHINIIFEKLGINNISDEEDFIDLMENNEFPKFKLYCVLSDLEKYGILMPAIDVYNFMKKMPKYKEFQSQQTHA